MKPELILKGNGLPAICQLHMKLKVNMIGGDTPPPYESSFNQDPQRRNDWHCLLENEMNNTRQDNEAMFH
ncbi:unnamed protein product [Thelazia callipaeda]|uniref:Uncharacterized protein n=1 Tax=Thelazia callipaeda TaxID=103827 RepID=A0A0N5D3F1_THECL|nr:unnamed protein product [Thelazia callipaeda]